MPISNRNSGVRASMDNGQPAGTHAGGQSEIAVFSTDRQGNFLACNQAFTQLMGYESPELVGLKFTDTFWSEEAAAQEEDHLQPGATILALVSGKGHYQSELCAKPKSGET